MDWTKGREWRQTGSAPAPSLHSHPTFLKRRRVLLPGWLLHKAFSVSRVWRLFMPRSSNAALLRGRRCFCVSLDLGRESSTSIKLWNLVSYCIAGDPLPSWPLGHCLLFPMLTHPISLPLANHLLCTKESSSYVL